MNYHGELMSIFNGIFSNKENVINLDPESFENMMNEDSDCIILDVRTLEENINVRIPNSVLIDIYKPDFIEKVNELDRKKKYLVYCRSGNRSYSACSQMQKMGFEKIFNLGHGIIKWNGKVEKG